MDFRFGMTPNLDPAEEEHVEWLSPELDTSQQRWPQGPMRWIKQDDGNWEIMAVGSVDGKERREIVATFHPDKLPETAKQRMVLKREQTAATLERERSATQMKREDEAITPVASTSESEKTDFSLPPQEVTSVLPSIQQEATEKALPVPALAEEVALSNSPIRVS